MLPGKRTIPDQIAENRKPYYEALERADEHWRAGKIDLGEMEKLLSTLLARQLLDVIKDATGD